MSGRGSEAWAVDVIRQDPSVATVPRGKSRSLPGEKPRRLKLPFLTSILCPSAVTSFFSGTYGEPYGAGKHSAACLENAQTSCNL